MKVMVKVLTRSIRQSILFVEKQNVDIPPPLPIRIEKYIIEMLSIFCISSTIFHKIVFNRKKYIYNPNIYYIILFILFIGKMQNVASLLISGNILVKIDIPFT